MIEPREPGPVGPGTELDGFVIEGVAGRGGMGVVYTARQRRPDRIVALKVIMANLADDPEFRARFERESRIAAQIEHPNVIPVYAIGEARGVLYIAMRFVEGIDMRTLLTQEGRLEPGRAAAIVDQAAHALDAAHARALVHRDVKPENILISRVGGRDHVYLSDFGLSRPIEGGTALTGTHAFLGTIDYAAPEQARGERVDARTDVYSLGCVLFRALTGTVPFPGDNDVAKLMAREIRPPPSALERVPELPAAFETVLKRAMAKAPSQRYLSAGDLGRAAVAAASARLLTPSGRSVAIGAAAPDDDVSPAPVPASAPVDDATATATATQPDRPQPPAEPPAPVVAPADPPPGAAAPAQPPPQAGAAPPPEPPRPPAVAPEPPPAPPSQPAGSPEPTAAHGTEATGPPRRRPPIFGRERPRRSAGLAALLVGLAIVAFVLTRGGHSDIKVIDPVAYKRASGSVTYCTGADNVVSSDGRETQHQTAVNAFEQRFGADVQVTLRPFSKEATEQYKQFKQLLQQHSAACDVYYSDVPWTADFASHRWLYDLSRYAKPRLGSFVPAMRDAAVFQGRVWGVPKQADAGLLFYNKSVAGAAPATWQEVYRRAAPNRRLRYQGSQYEGLTVNFLELAYAVGAAKIVTSDGKANIDQPDARTALQFMVDGIKNGAVPREIAEQTEDSSIYAFGRGRADYMRMWPYAYAELQNPAKFPQAAGKVGVAPLPSWAGRTPVSVLGGHMLVISAFSKHPDAALKLVDFLSSAEVLKRDATEFSLAPALLALWNDQQVEQALPASGALRDAIFHARSRPVIPNYPEVSRAIYENVHRALRRDVTPEAALRQAQFEMQQAIDAH